MCQVAIDNRCYTTWLVNVLTNIVNKITCKKDKKSVDIRSVKVYNKYNKTNKGDQHYDYYEHYDDGNSCERFL